MTAAGSTTRHESRRLRCWVELSGDEELPSATHSMGCPRQPAGDSCSLWRPVSNDLTNRTAAAARPQDQHPERPSPPIMPPASAGRTAATIRGWTGRLAKSSHGRTWWWVTGQPQAREATETMQTYKPVAHGDGDRTDAAIPLGAQGRQNLMTTVGITPSLPREPRLYTVSDVSQALQISVRTLRRATTSGLLPCHRLGRSIRYNREDLEIYLTRIADVGLQ